MAVAQELLSKIQSYQDEGYSPDEVIQGIQSAAVVSDGMVKPAETGQRRKVPTPQEVWKDPDFLGLHPVEKAKVMRAIDPEFAGLPSVEQHRVVFQLTNRSAVPQAVQPEPEGEPVGRLDAGESARDPFSYTPAETEAMRRRFVADEMSFGGDSPLTGSSRDVMGIGGTAQMRDQTRTAAIEAGKKLVRPVLKTVGAVGGTVAAGGNPAGTVAGYAIGDEVANLVTGERPASVPTAPAESVADFATRVVPESLDRNIVGMGAALPMLAGDVVNRTADGQNPLSALVGTATDAASGMGEKVARVMGLHGLDAMKEELSSDPVFAASVLLPITTAGAKVGAKGVRAAGSIAGDVGAGLLGTTTGTGGNAIRQAAQGSPVFRETMRAAATSPEAVGVEIVDRARGAVQQLREDRGAAYRSRLSEIAGNTEQLDVSPVVREWERARARFGIKTDGDGNLDLSRSTLGRKELADVQEISDMLNGWGREAGDLTPMGLDLLKRKLDNLYTESKDSRAIVAGLRSTVKKTIVDAVPEYAGMVKGYEEATGLISELERSLSLGKKPAIDTTLRRLTQTMRDNNEFRRDLLSTLENSSGENLADMIAGYSMSSWAPQGGFGKLASLGAVGGVASHVLTPSYLGMLALSSPRLVGESLYRLGATSKTIGKVIGSLPRLRRATGLLPAMGVKGE